MGRTAGLKEFSMEPAPLAGVRIVAGEQFGAGPFGTLHLADLGADIIRLEDPSTGGGVSRYVAPGQRGTDSLYFDSFNRGKRSMLLDLKSPAGQEVLHELCGNAHAVYANLRGDALNNLGLTYDVLGRINPAIVCVSLSAYGRDGERSTEPGYDPLIQAEAGWARSSSFDERRRNRDELLKTLRERFREQSTAHWVGLLRGHVPVAPVRSMEAALDREELEQRAMLAAYRHPALGDVTTVGLPIKMGGYAPTYRPGPALDGDRDAILSAAG